MSLVLPDAKSTWITRSDVPDNQKIQADDFNLVLDALTDLDGRTTGGTLSGLFPDGTITSPALSFVDESNSGIYRAASGDFRFSIQGVDVLKFLSSGAIKLGTSASQSATATPITLSLGGTYSNSPGLYPKLKLWDWDSNDPIGLGASSNQMDLVVPTGMGFGFYIGGTRRVQIDNGGGLSITGGLTIQTAGGSTSWNRADSDGALATTGGAEIRVGNVGSSTGTFYTWGGSTATIRGNAADGGSAVGVVLNNNVALSTGGAKILSVRNNDTEKFYVDKDGSLVTSSGILGSIATGAPLIARSWATDGGSAVGVALDTGNTFSNSAAKLVSIRNGGSEKVYVDKDGKIVTVGGSITIQGASQIIANTMLPYGGNTPATISGAANDSGSAVGVILNNQNTFSTSGAKLVSFRNNGSENAFISWDGSFNTNASAVVGSIYGFTGQLGINSQVTESGSPVIGLILNNSGSLSVSGSKLVSFRNGGVEKAYIDKDGKFVALSSIVTNGYVYANRVQYNNSNTSLVLVGGADDGGSAVGVIIDNGAAALVTTGAKILSIRNNGTEKAYFDKDGGVTLSSSIVLPGSVYITDDSGYFRSNGGYRPYGSNSVVVTGAIADGASAVGVILDNSVTLANSTAKLLSIRNNGTEKAYIGWNGQASFVGSVKANAAFYSDGTTYLQGWCGDASDAVATVIESGQSLTTPGAKIASFRNGGAEKAYVDLNGAVVSSSVVYGVVFYPYGSTSSLSLSGRAANGGSAVGTIIDNNTTLSTAGAKLVSVRNNGSEKAYIDLAGRLTLLGAAADEDAITIPLSSRIALGSGVTIKTDGTNVILATGINIAAGAYAAFYQSNTTNTTVVLKGRISDGASAVGVSLDNNATLSNATAKLVSIRNNGTEKAYFDKDGGFTTVVGSGADAIKFTTNGARIHLGTGSNDYLYSDGAGIVTPGYLWASDSVYSPLFRAASGSSASIAGSVADGGSAVGVIINNLVTLNTTGAKLLSVRNNGSEKMYVSLYGDITAADLTGLSANNAIHAYSFIQSGYVETNPINFRFDQDVIRFCNRWPGITFAYTGGFGSGDVDALFSQYADFINLNGKSDNASIEVTGFSIGNSADVCWYPYVLSHSGFSNVNVKMEILKAANPSTWEVAYNGAVSSFYIAQYISVSSNLIGARWTFYNMASPGSPFSTNQYIRSLGVIGRNSQGYAWSIMKSGDTIFGNFKIAPAYSIDTDRAGTLQLGVSTADAITIGKTGVTVSIPGVVSIAGGHVSITTTSGAQRLLMGNQDSSGVNNPAIIHAANGEFYIGHGNSWTGDGGTLTTALSIVNTTVNAPGWLQENGSRVWTAATFDPSTKAAVAQTMYIGTTSVAINRGSGTLSLTGITSIDGSSASCTGLAATATALATPRAINGVNFDGTAAININLNNAITFNNGGAGAASGTTFDGSAARTISYNSIGAAAAGQTMYIGTTSVAINRASASLALTGITSIDGSAATLTTSRNINGVAFNGSANISINLNNACTFNNGGSGAASGTTFDGSAARTISYNTIGAIPSSGATYIQSTGLSTSWNATSGTSTGGFNALMGSSGGATWLLSGTQSGTFRYGVQGLNDGNDLRLYSNGGYLSLSSSILTTNVGSVSFGSSDVSVGVHLYMYPGTNGAAYIQSLSTNANMGFTSNLSAGTSACDFMFTSSSTRTVGSLMAVYNNWTWKFQVITDGSIQCQGNLQVNGTGDSQILGNLNVGVGTTGEAGDICATRTSAQTTGVYYFANNSGLYIYWTGGQFNINGGALYVQGDVIANTSDRRLKKDLVVIPDALSRIMAITGYTFNWDMEKCATLGHKPHFEHDVGVLAQDVESVLPEAVCAAPFSLPDANGNPAKLDDKGKPYKTVRYEKLTVLLIEAVKELGARLAVLEMKN